MDHTPDTSLQEAAQAMRDAAERGRAVLPVLETLCPHVCRQIRSDREHAALFSFWGRSLNFDENVGRTIVDPATLGAIGELAGVPMRGRVVHAGLQHTYGYLFSLIQTPYGLKRDRWVSEDWEVGFGLDRSLLGPRPDAGTLLANLTWFAGRVAYRGLPGPLGRLNRVAAAVSPELVGYDFDRLRVCRLEERATPATGRAVRIVTDLVPFPRPPAGGAEDTVLVYSTQNGPRAGLKIVTAFPVKREVVEELKASSSCCAEVRPRYNAHLPGFDRGGTRGVRTVSDAG